MYGDYRVTGQLACDAAGGCMFIGSASGQGHTLRHDDPAAPAGLGRGSYRCSCGVVIPASFRGMEEDWDRLDASHRDLLTAMALAAGDAQPQVPIERTVALIVH
jgi:hypothetical protein